MYKVINILKIWIIPAFILLVLVSAWYARWDYTATQTTTNNHGDYVFKWKMDHWTGNVWVETYKTYVKTYITYNNCYGYKEAQLYKEAPLSGNWYSRTQATNIGIILTLVSSLWFMWSFIIYLWPRLNRDKFYIKSIDPPINH